MYTLQGNVDYEVCIRIYYINLKLLLCAYLTCFRHIFQAVLKSDRNNYVGLVLFGAALQDSEQKDQAPKAFRKAIEVSPKQLLAWQGLASFYEKENSESDQEELFPIYQQLLSLERHVLKPPGIRGSNLKPWKLLLICDILLCYSVTQFKVDVILNTTKLYFR